MTRILDHCRTTDPHIQTAQGERRHITAQPNRKSQVDTCDGCLGPRVESHWSNARRNGRRFCSHSCMLLKQAAERGGGQ
jgi:hypothetical protein